MPYTVYKVTNQITGDFYIGVHKTSDPQDSYLGSGKVIRQQVALHGPENFTKEILLITEVKREAYEKEAELVNPLLGTPGCLNLHPGGHGGFGYVNAKALNSGGNHDPVVNDARRAKRLDRMTEDPEFKQQMLDRLRQAQRDNPERTRAIGVRAAGVRAEQWRGQQHSAETCLKLRVSHTGSQNSQYGTAWVSHPQMGTKKIKIEDLPVHLISGWCRGRST